MKKNKKNVLGAGFIIGTIIGAASTFFLAPQKGIETQKKLAKNLNTLFQKVIIKTQNILLNLEILLTKK